MAGALDSAARMRSPTFRASQLGGAQVAPADAGLMGTAPAVTPATPGLALHVQLRRNPRLLGAAAYAMPLLPALVLLLRVRRNRFVRAHAVQALIFFATLALVQVALFALLVAAGGQTTSLRAATMLAAGFAFAWLAVAALGFIVWTRLVAAALEGHIASLPLVTPLAQGLLRGLDRITATLGRRRNTHLSAPEGAPRRMTFS